MSHTYYLYTDGGSRGNPGPAAWAYVITDEDKHVLAEKYGYLGVTTNNQAEYAGLINGLEAATKLAPGQINVRMDSELIVKQMQGLYKVKHPDLQPLYLEVLKLTKDLGSVKFGHIPRNQNEAADSLVNQCLDSLT